MRLTLSRLIWSRLESTLDGYRIGTRASISLVEVVKGAREWELLLVSVVGLLIAWRILRRR